MSQHVLHIVARHWLIKPSDIIGRSRNGYFVNARSIAAYLMRHGTGMSYPSIGRRIGGRDHSSIIHLCKKAKIVMHCEPPIAGWVVDQLKDAPFPILVIAPFNPHTPEPRFDNLGLDNAGVLAARVKWARSLSSVCA